MVKKKFTTSKVIKGKTYQYFRKDGVYVRLPDDPLSEEYDRAYWNLMRGKTLKASRLTFDKLIVSYKQSPKWERLAPRTKKDYSKVLDYLHETVGGQDPTKMRKLHVIDAQMANKHRARFANYIPHMLSILFKHPINLDWQRDNPAHGVEKLVTGEGHSPWPQWAIDIYREKATGIDLLIFELAIGTGQRASDVLKMKWADISDNGIYVKQGKTKTDLWIPLTEQLARTLEQATRTGLDYIVADEHGRQLKYDQAQKINIKTRKALGLQDYSLHGLRYSAASELAEAGCTDQQIAAVTGHKSLSMVKKYSKGASQKRLAKQAMKLREQNRNGT